MSGIAQAIEDNRLRRLIVGKEPVTLEERLARVEAIIGCAVATEAAGDKAIMLRRQYIIATRAAEACGFTLARVMLKTRKTDVAWARFAGMYLMRLLLPMSFREIAAAYHFPDHSIANHAVAEVADRMSVEPAYAREIGELTERVKKEIEI